MNKIGLLLLTITAFHARAERIERLIAETTNVTRVRLDAGTVRCSDLGYGNRQLKVSVPALKMFAVFDHSNLGETEPCITAGRCRPGNDVSDILIPGLGDEENITLHVALVEVMELDRANGVCHRELQERVRSTVRGKAFTHLRQVGLGQVPLSRCE